MLETNDLTGTTINAGPSRAYLMITALGAKSDAALDSEVIVIGYLCQITRQQVKLNQRMAGNEWRQITAAVPGVEFPESFMSRAGSLIVPRLPQGFLAVVSHPWSGMAEFSTPAGRKRIDLYSEVFKVLLIDTSSGVVFETDPAEVKRLRSVFADAKKNLVPADQREAGMPRPAAAFADAAPNMPANQQAESPGLAPVLIRAVHLGSDSTAARLVSIVEFEPVAGLFIDLTRISAGSDWNLSEIGQTVSQYRMALSSQDGSLQLQASLSGSIVFLCGPEAGIVELDIFGQHRKIDLHGPNLKLRRVHFDSGHALPLPGTVQRTQDPIVETKVAAALRQRRDFYAAAVMRLDPKLPTGLYVPRWKEAAASAKNLLPQTLPCPHNMDGRAADMTAEDVQFYSNVLLSSSVKHFVVSGGDVFWIDIIRRVQWEDPSIRFDLLWHGNYLQMGEPHGWNLLKNWQRAIADGLVTKVAVVKSGLEEIFASFGAETMFIPNFIRADPNEIRYNGPHDLVGIWLSGSSAYGKVPFASLLALKALPQARLIGAGFDDESLAMVTELRIPRGDISRLALPQEALYRGIQRTGLTFHVTLSECAPMLPLDSMQLGVPCLVGACSHLFRSHPYLYRTLVVKNPLSAEAIAAHAKVAMAEGEQIIAAFRDYGYQEQELAKLGLARFLG